MSPNAEAPAPTPAPAIWAQGLSHAVREHFWRPRRPLLRGVSFVVEPGEVVASLGHNGAGKTTVLRVLLGLLRPDAGSARLFGEPVTAPQARAGLGFLPERPYYPPHLTAREFVEAHARLAGLGPRDAARETQRALGRLGLSPHAGRRLASFSKGMLQRAGLAQATVGAPRLLLLDEPLSGLDPVGRAELRAIVAEEQRRGCSVLFCTHVLADAEALCERAVVLAQGRVVVDGRLDALLQPAAGEPQAVRLRFAKLSPEAHHTLATLAQPSTAPVQRYVGRAAAEGETHAYVAADFARANEIVDWVRQHGGQLVELRPERRTLESLLATRPTQGASP